jgi:hypothetical protein
VRVPGNDNFLVHEIFCAGSPFGEVICQQNDSSIASHQQQWSLICRETDRVDSEIAEVLNMPRVTDQQPFESLRNSIPESLLPLTTAILSEHTELLKKVSQRNGASRPVRVFFGLRTTPVT